MEKADSTRLTAAEGRRFAWTLAGAFAVLGGIAWWRGREGAAFIFAGLAGIFFLAGLVAPTRLGPVERVWMAVAHAISRVTTPLFMGIVYFVVLTPIGLFRRAVTKHTLSPSRSAKTFWVDRKKTEPEAARRRMERQF
jgi:saxitoxin biosynthesis operon SxtJ-like protein